MSILLTGVHISFITSLVGLIILLTLERKIISKINLTYWILLELFLFSFLLTLLLIIQYDIKLQYIYNVSISDIVGLTSWTMLIVITATAIIIAKAKRKTLGQ